LLADNGEDVLHIDNFSRKPEEKRSLGRSRRRWEDNIAIDRDEIGGEVVDGIQPAQDRIQWQVLAYTVMQHRIP
jgi:hypothetical protein